MRAPRTPSLSFFIATVRARDIAIEAAQEATYAVTESVAAELSRRWPRRLITLLYGHGVCTLTASTVSIYGRPAYWTFTLGAAPEHESNYVTEFGKGGNLAMSPTASIPVDLADLLRDVEAESIHSSAFIGCTNGRMQWLAGKRVTECPHDWASDRRLINGRLHKGHICRLCGKARALSGGNNKACGFDSPFTETAPESYVFLYDRLSGSGIIERKSDGKTTLRYRGQRACELAKASIADIKQEAESVDAGEWT